MGLPLLSGLEDVGRNLGQARRATIMSVGKWLTDLGIPLKRMALTMVF
jgi:hypothetical protein